MSDQTPWGTTPPSNAGQPPTGPPPTGQPPTGQPPTGQPPVGPPPGSPYGNPYQPTGGPPPRRNTGLIVGLIVGGAVLVLAVVLVGVLAVVGTFSGDDDGEGEASSATSSESPAPEPDENTVQGTGYQYQLPGEAWTDASADAADLGPTIDSISVLGSSVDTAQSNILIETGPAGSAELEELEPAWQRNISGSDKAETETVDAITIAGEPAVGVTVERTNGAGVPITQIAYLTVHDGEQFSIALSYPTEGDDVSRDDFETALASWAWAS